jgi:NhaA family Na+:H+ antiporter
VSAGTRDTSGPAGRIAEFLRLESAGGIVLVAAAAIAIVWANSPLSDSYIRLLGVRIAVSAGDFALAKPLLLWVNDGLMAVFFLVVGLEIKREVLEGELASLREAALPAIAAAGGMLVPALVYTAFNWGDASLLRGWAIPTATDIAFALGVLALLGRRVPAALKVFLLALAIIDDLGAIVIIALFYTENLSATALGYATGGLVALALLNVFRQTRIAPYVLVGVFLWVCVLESGVHATLAGVAVAFALPLRTAGADGVPPARRVEHALHPWVTFAIMPLFALANAGVPFEGLTLATLFTSLTLGIALGLFVGKQLGVFGFAWIAVRAGWGVLPAGATWAQFYGVALLTGIGFTMSLFIGTLAVETASAAAQVRLGVLAGSLLSALAGYAVLRIARPAA